ncbi:hypothetical protein [Duganella callida]|uniref:Uncharacterized protein n=1 Tax=Duganella callida TaxID=2561932 RepID=A0A4Y9SHI2_9BURK|nr:hypothetical protein [Duganella callida]TFW19905.1 hypothetical protein E4L98_15665 [Duganella callida]
MPFHNETDHTVRSGSLLYGLKSTRRLWQPKSPFRGNVFTIDQLQIAAGDAPNPGFDVKRDEFAAFLNVHSKYRSALAPEDQQAFKQVQLLRVTGKSTEAIRRKCKGGID